MRKRVRTIGTRRSHRYLTRFVSVTISSFERSIDDRLFSERRKDVSDRLLFRFGLLLFSSYLGSRIESKIGS